MSFLNGLDLLAVKLGACKNVYITADDKLQGTDTDWRGIKGCLLATSDKGIDKPAMIVGAGGASRAALAIELECPVISENSCNIVHVRDVEQARSLASPYYIVGTVPDSAPATGPERTAVKILDHYLASAEERDR
ncbi:hypothetical protein D6C86_09421 [Aureobasidium pullulans]|uniref:Shikimate dehydrogenase substrate binding N-terminal domain-containing protein n=1 Tax=Aureobasidium pullulans TaxID=5580 RepID=A0A4S9PTH8_AURPU|nr:hypothetical protein D6C94_05224 [Aureobasidium pullulans]THZ39837.1 hypothetical protein D6C87_06840 [Aureobasidium pullulans]THZ54478.1 hypothetical protein D6C86_09421 [Aureobasidium pullulans]